MDEEGNKYFTMVDCWYPGEYDMIRGVERCFDLYGSDFVPPAAEGGATEQEADGDGDGDEDEDEDEDEEVGEMKVLLWRG